MMIRGATALRCRPPRPGARRVSRFRSCWLRALLRKADGRSRTSAAACAPKRPAASQAGCSGDLQVRSMLHPSVDLRRASSPPASCVPLPGAPRRAGTPSPKSDHPRRRHEIHRRIDENGHSGKAPRMNLLQALYLKGSAPQRPAEEMQADRRARVVLRIHSAQSIARHAR